MGALKSVAQWAVAGLGAVIITTLVVGVIGIVLSFGAIIAVIGVGVVVIALIAAFIHDAMNSR
jgi:hypothetical protein